MHDERRDRTRQHVSPRGGAHSGVAHPRAPRLRARRRRARRRLRDGALAMARDRGEELVDRASRVPDRPDSHCDDDESPAIANSENRTHSSLFTRSNAPDSLSFIAATQPCLDDPLVQTQQLLFPVIGRCRNVLKYWEDWPYLLFAHTCSTADRVLARNTRWAFSIEGRTTF